jgi:hypothetical protein
MTCRRVKSELAGARLVAASMQDRQVPAVIQTTILTAISLR